MITSTVKTLKIYNNIPGCCADLQQKFTCANFSSGEKMGKLSGLFTSEILPGDDRSRYTIIRARSHWLVSVSYEL